MQQKKPKHSHRLMRGRVTGCNRITGFLYRVITKNIIIENIGIAVTLPHHATMLTKALTVANNKNSFATLNKIIVILGVSSFSERKAKKHPISHDGLNNLFPIIALMRNNSRTRHKIHTKLTTQILNKHELRPRFFNLRLFHAKLKPKILNNNSPSCRYLAIGDIMETHTQTQNLNPSDPEERFLEIMAAILEELKKLNKTFDHFEDTMVKIMPLGR